MFFTPNNYQIKTLLKRDKEFLINLILEWQWFYKNVDSNERIVNNEVKFYKEQWIKARRLIEDLENTHDLKGGVQNDN